MSPEILEEYRRVAEELSQRFPSVEVGALLDFVTVNSLICAADPLPAQVCDDPDDDKFLACAVAGRAAHIVTGDRALLRMKQFHGARIMRPRTFVDAFLSE